MSARGGLRPPSVLNEEIRRVVKAAAAPLSAEEIGARVKAAAGRKRLHMTIYNMCVSGALTRHGTGKGGARYGVGNKTAPGGGSVKTTRPKTPRNGGVKGRAGAAPRWALASDGAFMLIGTSIEIPRPAAHALVEFIDVLRKGRA